MPISLTFNEIGNLRNEEIRNYAHQVGIETTNMNIEDVLTMIRQEEKV